MNKPTLSKLVCILLVFCAATAIASPAQVLFTTLHSFAGPPSDGAHSNAPLLQGNDGNFYGTTTLGGTHDSGTVFKITPSGKLTTLYSFCSQANCTDGQFPEAGLVLGSDGNFYGTTVQGGITNFDSCSVGCGTVFKITPSGTLTILHAFAGNPTEGQWPLAPVVQGTDGNFYGTTDTGGGSLNCGAGATGCGTVFSLTPGGTLTTLHSFQNTDGSDPVAGLIQATDGNFYGTTRGGGTSTNCMATGSCGTVFTITPQGAFTMLHSFDSSDGAYPWGGLVQAGDGNFYGTTKEGGASRNCSFQTYGCGTLFSITPDGSLTTLYSFSGTDGSYPYAGLVLATDGNFYGTTYAGGTSSSNCNLYSSNGCGTVFKATPSGALTTLHRFSGIASFWNDGANPSAGLVQATDGNFYGTTNLAGTHNDGTVFRLVMHRPCIVCPSVK